MLDCNLLLSPAKSPVKVSDTGVTWGKEGSELLGGCRRCLGSWTKTIVLETLSGSSKHGVRRGGVSSEQQCFWHPDVLLKFSDPGSAQILHLGRGGDASCLFGIWLS
jgi:hypothetical protein